MGRPVTMESADSRSFQDGTFGRDNVALSRIRPSRSVSSADASGNGMARPGSVGPDRDGRAHPTAAVLILSREFLERARLVENDPVRPFEGDETLGLQLAHAPADGFDREAE